MRHFLLCAVLLMIAPPAGAADMQKVADQYIVAYVGDYDITNNPTHTQVGAEWRMWDVYHGLRPTIGFNADGDGDVYGYGGGNWDIPLWHSGFIFTPNFMVGLYTSGSHENNPDSGAKSLGGGIEFRSGLELSYQFPDEIRTGVAFNHISNADIYSRNPGAETLLFNVQLPLSGL